MAKRGRKPKNVDKNYFAEKQELAVIDYIEYSKNVTRTIREILKIVFNCDDTKLDALCEEHTIYDLMEIAEDMPIENQNKAFEVSELKNNVESFRKEMNIIYDTTLRSAFEKMIESIIRRYRLYVPDEEFDNTFNDTLSFLITKIDKYDPSKGAKAYSYYGNVCKNYLIGRLENHKKSLQRNPSYDLNEDEFTNNAKYAIKSDKSERIATNSVNQMVVRITAMIESPLEYGLKENEIKLGKALKNLFENWDYVLSTDGSNKLNKNAVLFFLKEQTGLDAKGIRDNIKKFKKEYLIVKDSLIN